MKFQKKTNKQKLNIQKTVITLRINTVTEKVLIIALRRYSIRWVTKDEKKIIWEKPEDSNGESYNKYKFTQTQNSSGV